ncbi:hypothetical protein GKZ68_16440 [Hymenobacter sp. BRD128]|uniref:hypothetical protein n=1 Tax=Hymenobacter sp. BRD128 TaxID=2675878 RepID=UPI001562FB0A|nr:hypothetical protein [Hymenobacter sp. BRD128]QKG58070.1 hypothetical protein GKZ68_16440 [Hymenobacter sp. BRD128]
MKSLVILAAFGLASFATTSAHAQTTTTDPAVATPQTVQSTQATYDQQRDQRRMADQSVAENRRALRAQQSQARDLKHQMKAQRQQAKQQKEQLKMERQNAKAARTQEKAAKSQMKMEKQAAKDARKGM